MKPLLRAVLAVDALLLLALGVLFLLTPWRALFGALQLVSVEPAMVGQAFGVALAGLAWLAAHAAINGDLTAGIARAVGHVNWLTGVVMLVWLIGLRSPALAPFGQLVSVAAGVVLLVAGLGSVRLAAAVRWREKGEKGEKAQLPSGEPAAVTRRVEPAAGTGATAPAEAPRSPAAPGASATTHGAAGFDDTRPPMQD
ncbi:conserved membrane protein of unknown function [Burkholderia multivorans]